MIVFANASDGDAIALLVLAIPAFVLWVYILWIAIGGKKYDSEGNAIEEEEEAP